MSTSEKVFSKFSELAEGAVGQGLVLVFFPCLGLYLGVEWLGRFPFVGLPILAIFGILILFGALALVATLFARLGLSDRTQALALPEGSIRAAIALSLIVLFATISIMLYQSINKVVTIPELTEPEKAQLVKDLAGRVIGVSSACPKKCPSATPVPADQAAKAPPADCLAECSPDERRYTVILTPAQTQESTDLAKQLLVLIGTLMTSVTSFYFAARATEPKRQEPPPDSHAGPENPPRGGGEGAADESHVDGCDVPVTNATADEDLPAAKGGVA